MPIGSPAHMAVVWLRSGLVADRISMECRSRIGDLLGVFPYIVIYTMGGESPPIFVPYLVVFGL